MEFEEIRDKIFEDEFIDELKKKIGISKSMETTMEETSKELDNKDIKKSDSVNTSEEKKIDHEAYIKRAGIVSDECKGKVAEMILFGKTETEIDDYIIKSAMQNNQGKPNNKSDETTVDSNYIIDGLKNI